MLFYSELAVKNVGLLIVVLNFNNMLATKHVVKKNRPIFGHIYTYVTKKNRISVIHKRINCFVNKNMAQYLPQKISRLQ